MQVNVFDIFDELQRASHQRMSKVSIRACRLLGCAGLLGLSGVTARSALGCGARDREAPRGATGRGR